jgi:hypothetical protein
MSRLEAGVTAERPCRSRAFEGSELAGARF